MFNTKRRTSQWVCRCANWGWWARSVTSFFFSTFVWVSAQEMFTKWTKCVMTAPPPLNYSRGWDDTRHSKQIKSWSKIRFLVYVLKENSWNSNKVSEFKSKDVDSGNRNLRWRKLKSDWRSYSFHILFLLTKTVEFESNSNTRIEIPEVDLLE